MIDVVDIIHQIKVDTSVLTTITPYEFEHVVGELLASFGWEVSITSPTRDGGYDILGITKDASGLQTSWLVECKRYTENNIVGISVLRELFGIKEHLGIPNAILVTTSRFSRDAAVFSQSRNDLTIVDGAMVLSWIQGYARESILPSYTSLNSFSSCFISYSHKDEAFAQKLAASLKDNRINVWYAPEDIKPGQKVNEQIKVAISSFDRALVVLSDQPLEEGKSLSRDRSAEEKGVGCHSYAKKGIEKPKWTGKRCCSLGIRRNRHRKGPASVKRI